MAKTRFVLWLLACITIFASQAVIAEPTPTPTPTPPPPYTPAPSPYPTLTAPPNVQTSHTLPSFTGAEHWVHANESIQAAVNQAQPGDRIVLDAEAFEESVHTTKTLLFDAGPFRLPVWTGQ